MTWSAFHFAYQTVTLSSVPSTNPVCAAEEWAAAHLIPLILLLFPGLALWSKIRKLFLSSTKFPTNCMFLRLHPGLSKQEPLSQKELLFPEVTDLYIHLFPKNLKGKIPGRKKWSWKLTKHQKGKAKWVITNLTKDGHKATGQSPKQWQRDQRVQCTGAHKNTILPVFITPSFDAICTMYI